MNERQKPSWENLVDWVDGRLSPDEAERVEAWANQSESDADLAWLRAFRQSRQEIVLDEPPAELRSELRSMFANHAADAAADAAAKADRPSLTERLMAALSFDSGLQLGMAGARGQSAALRQLIYSADTADITLTLQNGDDGLQIDGQILPLVDRALDELRAELTQDGALINEAAVDASGHFAFASIAAGAYQLAIRSEALTIEIESIELRL